MNAEKMCRVSKTKSHFDRLLLARLSPTSALVSMDYKVSEMIWSFEIIGSILELRCVTCNAAWISSRVERKKKEGRNWVSSVAKNNFEGIWPCWKLRKQKKRLVWGKENETETIQNSETECKWYHKSISRRPIGEKKECERRLENEIHKLGLKLAEANMVCKYIID